MNQPATTTRADDHSLSRSLQPRHVAMITIGGIIGAGLFVGSSAAIAKVGPAVVLSYALTGGLVLLIMRMLGEMAVAMPQVRSFTEFARVGLGHWAGFAVGWLYWYFWVIVIPVEAIAGALILHDWLPGLPTWVVGAGLMALMTGVNLMSARSYGEFEFWFASIKVAAIIVFILMAGAFAFGITNPAGATFGNLTAHGGFMPFGILSVLAAVTTVFFALTGAEIVTIAAAESTEPAKAVARMTTTVVWRILIFYVCSIFLIVSVIPWTSIKPGISPFATTLDALHVSFAGTAMKAIILTAVLSCLNSAFYVASRVLFVLAERGDAPRWLVKTNARHVPARSVLLGSAAGLAGIAAREFAPDTVFKFLIDDSGAVIVFVYMAICVSQVVLRRARERSGVPTTGLTMWLFPWASYLTVAMLVTVLVAMAMTPEAREEFWVAVASVAVALAAYFVFRHGRATAAP
jgi:gamma-aminobutyrate permease